MYDFSHRDYGEGVFADFGVQTFTYGFEQKRYIFIFSFLLKLALDTVCSSRAHSFVHE